MLYRPISPTKANANHGVITGKSLAQRRLSERERLHALGVLERLREATSTRPATDVDRELRALRGSRRTGGRRHRSA